MHKKVFSPIILMIFLFACGQDENAVRQEPATSASDSPTPHAKNENRPVSVTREGTKKEEEEIKVKIENVEPEAQKNKELRDSLLRIDPYAQLPKVGWIRQLVVSAHDPAMLPIEKRLRGYSDWRKVGYTDDKGFFVDLYPTEDAGYRIGKLWQSEILPALNDLEITEDPIADDYFKAYRVLIPSQKRVAYKNVAGQAVAVFAPNIISLGNHSFIIDAQIFQIDGLLRSFDDASVGGLNSGSLSVEAEVIRGHGNISLIGQRGRSGIGGNRGRDGVTYYKAEGANGTDGTPGQDGGNGGSLFLKISRFEMPNKPDLSAGKPGQGGLGGAGGKGSHEAADGRPGHTADRGNWGKAGVIRLPTNYKG